MRDDLHALTLDLLAQVNDLAARGSLDDAPGVAPPEGEPAWAQMARSTRDEPLAGAAAMRAIREDLGDCKRCPLCERRKNVVFGVGDPAADLMIIGEGPGEQEDLRSEPFVGPAGEMLDKMLAHVLGLQRRQVYIANIVKCRTPGNRNPSPEEVATCRPFLLAQIEALQPKMLLVLGTVAYKALFDTNRGITASRGKWADWTHPTTGVVFPVMPTFHPAYLLRTPEHKRETFGDLKELRRRYDAEDGKRTT